MLDLKHTLQEPVRAVFVMFKLGKRRCSEGAFARFFENMLYFVIYSAQCH